VKVKMIDGKIVGVMPEFVSVQEAATSSGAPLHVVHAAAIAAAHRLLPEPAPGREGRRGNEPE
jgi:uncharacterized protein (DUF111 family)